MPTAASMARSAVSTFSWAARSGATPDAPAPAPAPAVGNTLSFQVGASGNTGVAGGGTILVSCAGQIVGNITVPDQAKTFTFSGPNVVPPVQVVYENEAPGRDAGAGLWTWNGVFDPLQTFWFQHNGQTLTVENPDVVKVAPKPVEPPPVPLLRPAELEALMPFRIAAPLRPVRDDQKLYLVGPGQPYATPAAAIRAAHADTSNRLPVIRIDPLAGPFSGQDECGTADGYIYKSMIIQSADPSKVVWMNGGQYGPANTKGLFTPAYSGITVEFENVGIYWCNLPGGGRNNACAISVEASYGTNIVVDITVLLKGCVIWGCGTGIGRGDGTTTVWNGDGCIFFGCGEGGEGYSHNVYTLGKSLTLTRCHSIGTKHGHLIKSRCLENTILDCVCDDGLDGTCSYGIDFPDGGVGRIERTLVNTTDKSENNVSIHMGQEYTADWHPISSLDVIDATITSTHPDAVGIRVGPPTVTKPGATVPTMPIPHVTGLKVKGLTLVYDDLAGGSLPDGAVTVLP